ncbi:MAG: FAD/NAD(P)-binding protein [Acidobacteriota bacterium]
MTHSIAIIGAGPKGLYAFERLAAHLKARPPREAVEIFVFDRTGRFGAGPVYHPEQPEYLLLNFSIGHIDLWAREEPPAVTDDTPSMLAWCQRQECAEIATELGPDSYTSRALAGRYLEAGFEAIAKALPHGVSLQRRVGEVVDILRDRRGHRILVRPASEDVVAIDVRVDHVLLATGHPWARPNGPGQAEPATGDFIPFVYPVERQLAAVRPGSTVALRGMTLTFIDAALALTEGRGGHFVRGDDGRLSYCRSGREPGVLLPFSRSGLPAPPKAVDLAQTEHRARFVTSATLAALRAGAEDGRIDFERDVWPLCLDEMRWAWYHASMSAADAAELRAVDSDRAAVERAIERFHRHHPTAPAFDAATLLDPVGERRFASCADANAFAADYLRRELTRARRGCRGDAVKAALDTWRAVREVIRPFAAYGGFTPRSHRHFHRHTWPLMKRLVFGPPVLNVEKLLALVDAGVLNYGAGPDAEISSRAGGGFRLVGPRSGLDRSVDCLIDARMPKPRAAMDPAPLYGNLLRRGMVRELETTAADGTVYRPGALDLEPRSCFVRDAEGRVDRSIAAFGIPTEGTLFGNESLSRTKNNFAGPWAAHVVAVMHRSEVSRWSTRAS